MHDVNEIWTHALCISVQLVLWIFLNTCSLIESGLIWGYTPANDNH